MTLRLKYASYFSGKGERKECRGFSVLARSQRNRLRDNVRRKLWRLRKQERKRVLADSFWDPEKAELVAVDLYYLLDVEPGEVLFDQRGHVSPALGVF